MFAIIPLKAELRLGRLPVISYIVIVVCVFLFVIMQANREHILQGINDYCVGVHDSGLPVNTPDYLRLDIDECADDLMWLYNTPDLNLKKALNRVNANSDYFSDKPIDEVILAVQSHLDTLEPIIAQSLDAAFNFNPSSWNVLKMITSSVAHADLGHIIGNLIFFFAFAPAVEILINHKKRYGMCLLFIALSVGFADSIASTVTNVSIPTLGLSGVVLGVIGMSAYLMPRARIRTFIWLLTYVRIWFIPAWILFIWYIGFDIYYLAASDSGSGVNFLAHVTGGIGGYLIASVWFKVQRKEYQEELDDEINYLKGERYRFGIMSTFASKRVQERMGNEQREHLAKVKYSKYVQKLYRYVANGKNSAAIVLYLENYEFYRKSPEIYEELFDEMKDWSNGRAYLCLGRLIIDCMIADKKYTGAMQIARLCLDVDNDFVLADPNVVAFFAKECLRQQNFYLAYALVQNSEARYYSKLTVSALLEIEANILEQYMDRQEDASAIRGAVHRVKS